MLAKMLRRTNPANSFTTKTRRKRTTSDKPNNKLRKGVDTKMNKTELRLNCVKLAAMIDNHDDIDSVINNSERIRKWVTKK